jgi:hypothetical protein
VALLTELGDLLRRKEPVTDTVQERVLLGDVLAAIEARQQYWPE